MLCRSVRLVIRCSVVVRERGLARTRIHGDVRRRVPDGLSGTAGVQAAATDRKGNPREKPSASATGKP